MKGTKVQTLVAFYCAYNGNITSLQIVFSTSLEVFIRVVAPQDACHAHRLATQCAIIS